MTFQAENDIKIGFPRRRGAAINKAVSYLEVLKPLPSALLAFIGVGAAVVAVPGELSLRLLSVFIIILLAVAGANGLTNYLDRHVDARMKRPPHRPLPSGRISPPWKVLPLVIGLIAVGLGLSWLLHPFVFLADLAGTLAAATWRKKVTCVYPQGLIASSAPVLMGWFAVRSDLGWELLMLLVLVGLWLPLHVWSVMISHRDDYRRAGLGYFPMNREVKDSVRVLGAFSVVLYAASIVFYFVGDFGWLYLAVAGLLGAVMVYASSRLVVSKADGDAWRLYRLSAFPYLGVIFLAMSLDKWLLS